MIELIVGAILLSAAAAAVSSTSSGSGKYTGVTCPVATADLVDWSTDSWWHPTPTEDLEWSEFRDRVELTPEDVGGSPYLPWQKGWEPWREFLGRPEAHWEESFYETELPSGKKAWVWVGSGVEHWWTPDGYMDVQEEDEILQRALAHLEQMDEQGVQIELPQVRQAVEWARAGL